MGAEASQVGVGDTRASQVARMFLSTAQGLHGALKLGVRVGSVESSHTGHLSSCRNRSRQNSEGSFQHENSSFPRKHVMFKHRTLPWETLTGLMPSGERLV